MAVKIPIRNPVSQIDTTASDAFSALGDLVLELAQTGIENKTAQEEKRVSNAMSLLSDLKRKKDNIELSYLEKQAQIAAYTGEAKNLNDIYKTGADGVLGSNMEDITADLYTEPFKYIEQSRQVIQNQMDVLNPQIMDAVDQLAKLSQAEDFLTKGIGATYTTGASDKQQGMWGAEDLSKAVFKEKFYPGDQVLPESVAKYFGRTPADPSLIIGLEQKRIDAEWIEEQKRMERARFEREGTKFAIETGAETRPYTQEVNRSLEIATRLNTEITSSEYGMMAAGMYYGLAADNIASGEDPQENRDKFNAEAFRIGLLFSPGGKIAGFEGIGVGTDIRTMPEEQLRETYQKTIQGKNKQLATRAIEFKNLGEDIFNENHQRRKLNELAIGRGMLVDPAHHLGREELVARAYRNYRGIYDDNPTNARKYADDVEFILGFNVQHEGSIRKRLKQYFVTDYMTAAIDKNFENVNQEWLNSLTERQQLMAGEWVDYVKNTYNYDITTDRWISGWKRLADGKRQAQFE